MIRGTVHGAVFAALLISGCAISGDLGAADRTLAGTSGADGADGKNAGQRRSSIGGTDAEEGKTGGKKGPTLRVKVNELLSLPGSLDLPERSGRVPAVILLHDCEGLPSDAVTGWIKAFHAWGYATFTIDSYVARGASDVCANPDRVWAAERVPDAYAARHVLAKHSRVDAERIALMGLGEGGTTALRAATQAAAERYLDKRERPFRAALALYPNCVFAFAGRRPDGEILAPYRGLSAPIRIHAAQFDDWASAKTCETFAQTLAKQGLDVTITVYEGALHGFDDPDRLDEVLPNVVSFPAGQRKKGGEVEGNRAVTEQARRLVAEQLRAALGG